MGFRNNIALLSRERYELIKDMTMDEINLWWSKETGEKPDEDGDVYVPIYKLSREVFELGKYCELDYLKPYRKDIFSNKEFNKDCNTDHDFYIIGKEGYEAVIEWFRNRIQSCYESILKQDPNDINEGRVDTVEDFLKKRIRDWKGKYIKPYDINLDREHIVSSWEYEYEIFELVRVYKSIDWDKEVIVITGW